MTLVAALTTLGLMLQPLQSANAVSVVATAFQLKCTIGGSIGYPVVGPGKGADHPLACVGGNKHPKAPNFFVAVQQDIPGSKTYVTKPGPKKGIIICVSGVTCNGGLSGTGFVGPGQVGGPWCGHSNGHLSASLNGSNTTIEADFITAAQHVIFIGTVQHGLQVGPFFGYANAAPDATKGKSCASAPFADKFLVVGVGVGIKFSPALAK